MENTNKGLKNYLRKIVRKNYLHMKWGDGHGIIIRGFYKNPRVFYGFLGIVRLYFEHHTINVK